MFESLSNASLENAWIESIEHNVAKEVIEEYEYLGTGVVITTHRFGMYFQTMEHGTLLGGVLCFGPEYSLNLGHWDKFGLNKDNFFTVKQRCKQVVVPSKF